VILPGAAYTEENGIFVNTEGRPQMAMRAGFAPGDARENWAILRALSAELGQTLPYDSLSALREAMIAEVPHLGKIDEVPVNDWQAEPAATLGKASFVRAVKDFYLTNPIARASQVMAELSQMAADRRNAKVAAE
jgi:NADH-quinone oxidoreductase subunit G